MFVIEERKARLPPLYSQRLFTEGKTITLKRLSLFKVAVFYDRLSFSFLASFLFNIFLCLFSLSILPPARFTCKLNFFALIQSISVAIIFSFTIHVFRHSFSARNCVVEPLLIWSARMEIRLNETQCTWFMTLRAWVITELWCEIQSISFNSIFAWLHIHLFIYHMNT